MGSNKTQHHRSGFESTNPFLLIEVDEIHNTEAIDGDYGGAKLAEIVFIKSKYLE